MTEILERILARRGADITVRSGGAERAEKAFLQPIRDRSKAVPYEVTTLGSVDDRLWICMTRAALADGDTVAFSGQRFTVRSCVPVYAGDETAYHWAVLENAGEAAE